MHMPVRQTKSCQPHSSQITVPVLAQISAPGKALTVKPDHLLL